MKVIIKADFWEGLSANIEFDYPQQVEVVIDVEILKHIKPIDRGIRFFCTPQPEGAYNDLIRKHPECYDYLLTPFQDMLDLPHARLFTGCGSFLDPEIIPKTFGVSTIMSGRNCLPGHKLRFELYQRRHEIKIPLDFYLGSHNRLPDAFYTSDCMVLDGDKKDKRRAMNRLFHIAIDSFNRDNHYSEKLIDCLVTKTVPIYWGAKNIEKFFDISGILVVNSVDDIIRVCNALSENTYEAMLPGIENNFRLAMEEYNFGHMLEKSIKKCLGI